MTAPQLLEGLTARGVVVTLDRGVVTSGGLPALRFADPHGALTPRLREVIAEAKPRLVALLDPGYLAQITEEAELQPLAHAAEADIRKLEAARGAFIRFGNGGAEMTPQEKADYLRLRYPAMDAQTMAEEFAPIEGSVNDDPFRDLEQTTLVGNAPDHLAQNKP